MNKDVSQALTGIARAYGLMAADAVFWSGVTVLYLGWAAILLRLPFVGEVLLVLVTPAAAAGVLREADTPRPGRPFWPRAGQVLVGALRDHDLALPVMSVATIALGAWVFVTVLAMILGIDGLTLSGIFAYRTPVARLFTGLLLLLFWATETGLVMTALYVLAGIVRGGLRPVAALEYALDRWREQPVLIALQGALLVLPLILAFYAGAWLSAAVAFATLIPLNLAVSVCHGGLKGTAAPSRSPLGT